MNARVSRQPLTDKGTPRRLVTLIKTLLMFESSLYSVLTPILPHYAHALGASKPAIGVLTGAYTAGLIPGSLLGGWMSARAGVRRTTFAGLALFAVAVAAFGFATNIVALDGLRAIQGFACGGIWGGALTWVIAATPASRRGRVLGSAFSAAILGTLLGPAVGTAAVWLGTGVVFAALGAIAAGLAAWVLRFPDAAIAPVGDRAPIGRLLRNRALLLGSWLMLLEAGALGVVYTLIPLRLSHFGGSSVVIGAIFLVGSGVRTLIAPQIGALSDRRGALAPTAVGLVLAAVVMAAVPIPQSVAALAVVSVIVMAGPLTTFVIPASSLLTVGAERAGVSLAIATMIFNLSFALGQTIGAPAGASLAQATTDAVPFFALAALLLLTLALVLAWRGQSQVAEAAAPLERAQARRPQAHASSHAHASSPAHAPCAQDLGAR
jgi:predicted MFS family arabinose efflux permease